MWLPEPVEDLHSSVWQTVLGDVFQQEGHCSAVHVLQAWCHRWNDSLVGWQVADDSHKVFHGQSWLRQAYVCEALSRIDACHLEMMELFQHCRMDISIDAYEYAELSSCCGAFVNSIIGITENAAEALYPQKE